MAEGRALQSVKSGELEAGKFLGGNQGIQGSNLFVRLDVLLKAGLFDGANSFMLSPGSSTAYKYPQHDDRLEILDIGPNSELPPPSLTERLNA